MNKKLIVLAAAAVVLFAFITTSSALAADKQIYLKVTYGTRSPFERQVDVQAKPEVATPPGKMAKIKVLDEEDKRLPGFKMELTPTVGKDNPDLFIIKIKVWEARNDWTEGKMKLTWHKVIESNSRVKRGWPVIIEEKVAADRFVHVTVTPSYKK